MRFLTILSLLIFSLCAHAQLGKQSDSLFPKLHNLKPPVLIQENAPVTVAKDGSYLLDGKSRYLIGNIYYAGFLKNYKPTSGYPAELKWLYEQPLNYQTSQRIGFDANGVAVPNLWMKKYLPSYQSFFWDSATERQAMRDCIRNTAMTLYVDYTCSPWAHGYLEKAKDKLPPELFNVNGSNGQGNHWVPYAVLHPKGRQLYVDMWRTGAEFVRDAGGKVLFYELFNEPSYNDPSPHNRQVFAQRMEQKYKNPAAMNQAWHSNYPSFKKMSQFKHETENVGLYIEWHKFMEDAFVDICKLGVETIRKVNPDPNVGYCVQPMYYRVLPKSNINYYKLNKFLNCISTTTGGGDFLQAHFHRSLGRGKPIHDGETYMGRTIESHRDKLWEQMARGYNASYVFKWSRRGWDRDWGKDGSPEGGRKVAEKFPWLMLNPYATPTKALTGMMVAKREMMRTADLFFPRDRGIKRNVAVLISFPTERLSQATGNPNHDFVYDYAHALEYAHIPYDVILEEQFTEGRQQEYQVIVAAGVDAIYDESREHLLQYVKNGGTLVLGLEAMQLNEYGQENGLAETLGVKLGKPSSTGMLDAQYGNLKFKAKPYRDLKTNTEWKTVVNGGSKPIILKRPLGKGEVYYVAARMQRSDLMQVLGQLLATKAIKANCTIASQADGTPAYGIEVHPAKRNGLTGYILFNRNQEPQLLTFASHELKKGMAACDPLSGSLYEIKNGKIMLTLQRNQRQVVVIGPSQQLAAKYGPLQQQSYDDALAAGQLILKAYAEEQARKAAIEGFKYPIDLTQVKMLDLRKAANRSFKDKVAGDGKGGWTDQGPNHLRGTEWGEHKLLGVPFNFIRWDHNEDRTCIVLKSKHLQTAPLRVSGIRVDAQVKALYFLHASAWTGTGKAFSYILNHPDGTKTEIPVNGKIDVADWFKVDRSQPGQTCRPAWRNSEGRGLFAWSWENPKPTKVIDSIDVLSANGNTIPIVVAITAERFSGKRETKVRTPFMDKALPTGWQMHPWNGVQPKLENNILELKLGPKAKDWCGIALAGSKPFSLPKDMGKDGFLSFEINGMPDEWGKPTGDQKLQIKLDCKISTTKKYIGIDQYITSGPIDALPDTWQPVRIPLSRLINTPEAIGITKLSIQFRRIGTKKVGVQIRNIAFEM